MGLRKAKIMDSTNNDFIIILTTAPSERIWKWMEEYKEKLGEGRVEKDFSSLEEDYYIQVLYDSKNDTKDDSNICAGIIGYEEAYDLNVIEVKTGFEQGRRMLIRSMENMLKENGYTILESDNTSIVVQNSGTGPNFLIKAKEASDIDY